MSWKQWGSGAQQRRAGMLAAAVALSLGLGAPAQGFEFTSFDGELWGSFDTTLSLGARWRMQKPDDSLIGIANAGTARSVNEDDGNLNWDRGDVVSMTAKATHDLELNYRNYGAFFRATYFYDDAVMSKRSLGSEARDQAGRDFELLDAYVRGDFDFADRWLGLRLGRQVVNWGESTFIQNGINVLNPIDVSRLRIPGSELREGLMPLNLLWAAHDLTDRLSVEGVWMFDWEETRIDPAGTFFSSNDFLSPGGKHVFIGFGRTNDLTSPETNPPFSSIGAPRGADREPGASGQYGVALRYFSERLNFTEFGLYHVRYHSRTPFASGVAGAPTVFQGGQQIVVVPDGTGGFMPAPPGVPQARYFAEYPEGIRVHGLSFNTPGPWGMALQGEYSYRPNQPVQIAAPELLLAALGQGSQIPAENIGADGEIKGYKRVSMQQLQLSATKAFGPSFGAQQFIALGEVGFTRLDLPRDVPFNAPGVHLPAKDSDRTTSFGAFQDDGYASRNSWGYRLVGRLEYPNTIAGATLSPRIVFSHDVKGRSPTFNEGARSLTLGLGINYLQNFEADISYTSFFGGDKIKGTDLAPNPFGQPQTYSSHTNPLKDRDFLAISISYSF